MWSFIILSVMWYEKLTKQHFPLSTLNCWSFIEHTSRPSKPRLPKFPPMRLMSFDHDLKMRWCAMSSNYEIWWDNIVMSFGLWALASFCVNMGFFGFKRDFFKIHDNIDVIQVANEIKPCGMKILSSTIVSSIETSFLFSRLPHQKFPLKR